MELMEAGSIPAKHSDAMRVRTIGAEATLQVTIAAQIPKERTSMNIKTKIKLTIETVVTTATALLAITCIGVRCCLVTPSA